MNDRFSCAKKAGINITRGIRCHTRKGLLNGQIGGEGDVGRP